MVKIGEVAFMQRVDRRLSELIRHLGIFFLIIDNLQCRTNSSADCRHAAGMRKAGAHSALTSLCPLLFPFTCPTFEREIRIEVRDRGSVVPRAIAVGSTCGPATRSIYDHVANSSNPYARTFTSESLV